MKVFGLLVCLVSILVAFPVWPGFEFNFGKLMQSQSFDNEQYLIKTGPNSFEVVDEATKLKYRRGNKRFIDVTNQISVEEAVRAGLINTDTPHLSMVDKLGLIGAKQLSLIKTEVPVYNYPEKIGYSTQVRRLFGRIDMKQVEDRLGKFTSFFTRYYKSESGFESAQWLWKTIEEIIEPVKEKVSLKPVKHEGWDQFSIIVSIPGTKSEDKVVVGAHQDSINLLFPNLLKAPGADDDGSGSMTTLESLRVLIEAYAAGSFKPHNTLEFHYYSGEEGGLKGSIDVFNQYFNQDAVVIGMLQQDMTGYTAGSLAEGIEPHFGLISDYTSINLNNFLKLIIEEYNEIPYHETECGYACSDHASALENGYPASFLIESEFKYTNKFIHSVMDTIDRLDFDHIAEHIKLTIAYAYELSMATNLHD